MEPSFLSTLGLTLKEGHVYTALLESGPLDARALSPRVGTTYPAIYRTLAALQAKGWIVCREGRPRHFLARPPAEVSALLRERMTRTVDAAASRLAAIESGTDSGEGELRLCRGLSDSMAALASLVRGSRDGIFAVSPGPLDREFLRMILCHLSGAADGAEWYLNVTNREDLVALRPHQGPGVRALAVIPRTRTGGTRLEHLFVFGGGTRMISLNAWYREGRLDRDGTHAICLSDAAVVRIQMEALVESTRVLVGHPDASP